MSRLPWRSAWRLGLSAALLAVVAVAAAREAPAIARIFEDLRPGWVAAGLGAFLAGHALRAHRLTLLSPEPLRLWPQAARVSTLHGLMAYLFPAQSGDLALPALLRNVGAATWRTGALLLVRVRLLDLCSVGLWILLSGAATGESLPPRLRTAWMACGAGLASLPLLLRFAPRLAPTLPSALARVLDSLGRAGRLPVAPLWESVAIWGLSGASLYATARAVALPLTLPQVWLITTIQLPLQLVPLQGVANSGNHEVGWVAGLALLGAERLDALGYALATHALQVVYIACLAPIAFAASLAGGGSRGGPSRRPSLNPAALGKATGSHPAD